MNASGGERTRGARKAQVKRETPDAVKGQEDQLDARKAAKRRSGGGRKGRGRVREIRAAKHQRRVWVYPCRFHPGKRCRSFFKKNYDIELCAKCRKAVPDERQISLLDRPSTGADEDVGNHGMGISHGIGKVQEESVRVDPRGIEPVEPCRV